MSGDWCTTVASKKVLIVDDEPFILDAVSSTLTGAGYEALTCHMWAGVANTVRTHEPDLVLLDYNMPGLRGDDICTILKRNGVHSRMKIVLFSAEKESDLVRIVSECGADGYVMKNTPTSQLLHFIAETLAS